ncbi:MAG: hypothetical protein PHF74_01785 [Dehalococcoidales bacterium]|nr:hypothetical protein [Dehalococcoidales bacterium]
MTDWQLTATTIFCEDMNDEVTIMVYRDGKTRCTGYDTFIKMNTDVKGKKTLSGIQCNGPVCHRVAGYKDKLFSEEKSSS